MSEESLARVDTDAVSDAVEALEDAGFDVTDAGNIERAGQGVSFDLSVRKLTRSTALGDVVSRSGTVEVSVETAREAFEELDRLIDGTEDDDPDPLTDKTFDARDELAEVLGRDGGRDE